MVRFTLRCIQRTAKHLCFPNASTCQQLTTESNNNIMITNRIPIPDRFHSVQEYRTTFELALTEELNLQLLELAKRFHSACQGLVASGAAAGSSSSSSSNGTMLVERVSIGLILISLQSWME